MNSPFEVVLNRYHTALKNLDLSHLEEEQILEILSARDVLQSKLENEEEIPINLWSQLIEQDAKLKRNAPRIAEILDFDKYRNTLSISEKAWWWGLDYQHPLSRFDGLWRVIKLLLLGVNFALIGTIATHFLSGASGFLEIGGLVFTTFISLIQAQNELSKSGENLLRKIMRRFKIHSAYYEQIQLGITLTLLLLLLGIWGNFSVFSEVYKNQGFEHQEKQEFVKAEKNYLKAIELDSDNLDAHFKLATLYEDLQDINQAKKHYLIAAKGGLLEAYNNLAYWYIREKKDAEAVELLETGINFIAKKDENREQLSEDEKEELAILRYSLYKNLGWARVKQERYQDAIPNLLMAKGIVEDPNYKDYIRGSGAVYCLHAQALEKTDKNSPDIKMNWQNCDQLISERKAAGDVINAEEDQWLYEAREKLGMIN